MSTHCFVSEVVILIYPLFLFMIEISCIISFFFPTALVRLSSGSEAWTWSPSYLFLNSQTYFFLPMNFLSFLPPYSGGSVAAALLHGLVFFLLFLPGTISGTFPQTKKKKIFGCNQSGKMKTVVSILVTKDWTFLVFKVFSLPPYILRRAYINKCVECVNDCWLNQCKYWNNLIYFCVFTITYLMFSALYHMWQSCFIFIL